MNVMGIESTLETIHVDDNGIEYILFSNAKGGGAIEVKDLDSGEMVLVKSHPKFDTIKGIYQHLLSNIK